DIFDISDPSGHTEEGGATTTFNVSLKDDSLFPSTPALPSVPISDFFNISNVSGHTKEDGTTATFNVALKSAPSEDVTVDVSSSNDSEGTVNPATLTFTPNNWTTTQTVTVTGVDDTDSDGHQHYGINLSVSALSAYIVSSGTCEAAGYDLVTSAAGCLAAGAITSPAINGGAYPGQPVNGYGDTGGGRTAGCTVHNFSLSAGGTTQYFPNASGACGTASFNCICTESSNSENVQVKLHNLDDDTDVTVAVSSSNTAEGTVSPQTLTFNENTWNTAQTVTVTGVDDSDSDGHQGYDINLSAKSTEIDFEKENPEVTTFASGLTKPNGVTTDGTNLYVAVTDSHIISKIVISTGEVSTFAGSGVQGSEDGTGTSASFKLPAGITTDGTNLYVMDTNNHKIRKIVISTGEVTTLAGSGEIGSSDGTGTSASFKYPHYAINIGTNLYVTDSSNGTIRKIETSTGIVTTFVGGDFRSPQGITTDGTNLYLVDRENNKIRKIVISTKEVSTIAGSNPSGYIDGEGTAAKFNYPWGITTDGTNLYVGDGDNNVIRKIVISTGVVSTLAGSGIIGSEDGTGTDTSFKMPKGLILVGTNLYVADHRNEKIRKIDLTKTVTADVALHNIDDDAELTVVASSSNTAEGTVSPGTLTFTEANWDTAQTVTVTGVDDNDADGHQDYDISLLSSGQDDVTL
ncbi:MAG: hypothetical protein HON77_16080, partial [Gammaproteobacteria bacterium]|nr:hypothetical protein [Gammaproteobacteria bacterium]